MNAEKERTGNGTETTRNGNKSPVSFRSTHSVSGEAVPAPMVLSELYGRAIAEERALLGASMFSGRGEAAAESIGVLRDPRHELIAKTISELSRHHIEVNIQSVVTQLQSSGRLTEAGGPAYVASLTSCDYVSGMEALHALHVQAAWKAYESARQLVEELERLLYGERVML